MRRLFLTLLYIESAIVLLGVGVLQAQFGPPAYIAQAGGGGAGIAFVAAADLGDNGGTTNTHSGSYTVSSGADRLLVADVIGDTCNQSDDVNAPTYNGVTMTLAEKIGSGSGCISRFQYQFFLVAPASGLHTFTVTSTSSHFLLVTLRDYTGAKQTGQPDAHTTHLDNTNGLASLTTSLTTVADNSWVMLTEASGGSAAPTAGTGATRRTFGATYKIPGAFDTNGPVTPAGSKSMTTNAGAGDDTVGIQHVLVSYAPAP